LAQQREVHQQIAQAQRLRQMTSHSIQVGVDVLPRGWGEPNVAAHHYGDDGHRQLLPLHLGALGGGQRLRWDVEFKIAQHLGLAGQAIAPGYLSGLSFFPSVSLNGESRPSRTCTLQRPQVPFPPQIETRPTPAC